MARKPTSIDPKGETPAKWSGPIDARQLPGAGTYPNYYAQKTRSGHVFMLDDSKFAESITLQHRSGSMLQMLPDGAVQIVTHNGRYDLTFGENRIVVTGAQDIVVQGAASLRVEKDYNVTVMGDMNTTVDGNYNMMAKNFNMNIGGNIDMVTKNMTVKTEGAMEYSAHETATLSADKGVSIASTKGSIALTAALKIGLKSYGRMMIESLGRFDIKTKLAARFMSIRKLSIMSKEGAVGIDAPDSMVYIQSGVADEAVISPLELKEAADANADRVRNAEISRIEAAEDNGLDDEIENDTDQVTDDLESDTDDTDVEPAQAPLKGVIEID